MQVDPYIVLGSAVVGFLVGMTGAGGLTNLDLYYPNVMRDEMHDWILANENMAKVLAAKGYHYQFLFARNAGHVDHAVKQQTLAEALEYIWQDYHPLPARKH